MESFVISIIRMIFQLIWARSLFFIAELTLTSFHSVSCILYWFTRNCVPANETPVISSCNAEISKKPGITWCNRSYKEMNLLYLENPVSQIFITILAYSAQKPWIALEFLFSTVWTTQLNEEIFEGFIRWREHCIWSCFIENWVQARLTQILGHCMKSVILQNIHQFWWWRCGCVRWWICCWCLWCCAGWWNRLLLCCWWDVVIRICCA